MNAPHLVRRFFGALRPGAPAAADERWVHEVLEPGEWALFARLPDHDRRHAIEVGRRTEIALGSDGSDGEERFLAAALLHDVGKYDAGLSVPGRALATMAAAGASGERRVRRWESTGGLRRRFACYARHGEIGAGEIRAAGGREEAAQWSAAHHHPEDWPDLDIPYEVVLILDAADQT